MTTSKSKFSLGTLIYLILAAAFAYAIYEYREQLVDIYLVLQQGVWYFVAATLLVLGVTIYNQVALYASIYNLLEIPSTKRELLPVYLVRRFVTVAAPSGGFSGWAPFLQFARRRELPIGTVFVANLIYTILWYSAFLVFLLVGLIYLFIMHDLEWFEISAALVMLATDIIMIAVLALSWVAPRVLEMLLSWLATVSERLFGLIKRRPPLSRQQFMVFASDLNQAADLMRRSSLKQVSKPVIHALLNESLLLLMFYLVAQSFGLHINFGVLVAAYSVSILFFVVSPTPGGLGFVEGTLIIVLTTLNVRADQATVVTLAYRGITFWLPFILGFVALRWFRKHPVREPAFQNGQIGASISGGSDNR
jgi:hypothetical protein